MPHNVIGALSDWAQQILCVHLLTSCVVGGAYDVDDKIKR